MLRQIAAALVLLLGASTVLGSGRELAPRPLGPSVYPHLTSLVAYAGGKYLTVWSEALSNAGGRYLGAFSDAEGKRISPSAFIVVPNGMDGPAHLLGTGNGFALFFPDPNGVEMMDITLDGSVTATRLVPIENYRQNPSVAWNGTHFAALENEHLVFFDRNGTIVRRVDLDLPCRPDRYEVLAANTDVVVASMCDTSLRVDVVANSGSLRMTKEIGLTPARGFVAAPAGNNSILFAWDNGSGIVSTVLSLSQPVRSHTVYEGPGEVKSLLLTATPDGFLLPFVENGVLRVAKLHGDGTPDSIADADGFGSPASAATDGANVLVADVHYVSEESRGYVRTRLVEPTPSVAATDVLSITPTRQNEPVLGAGSGTLLAVWTEEQGDQSIVRSAHVAADGIPYAGGDRLIASDASLVSSDVSWNGASYLTVVHREGRLYAQRVSAFGQSIHSTPLFNITSEVEPPRAAVVWAGDRWIVAGTDRATAFMAEVSSDGERGSWSQLALEGTLPDPPARRLGIYDVALAYDGEQVHIAWIERQEVCQALCNTYQPAFLSTVSRLGLEIGPPRRITHPSVFSISLALATDGEELVALVNDYDEKVALTTLGGISRTFTGIGDIAWDGSTFALALRNRERLTLRRLDALLHDAARVRLTETPVAEQDHSAPSVAVAFPGNAIIGIQETDAIHGGRAMAYAEQEIGDAPPKRRLVRR